MTAPIRATIVALVIASTAGVAHAQDSQKWFVRAGPALIAPSESATVAAGGAVVPGGNVSIKSRTTIEAEIGRFITPHIAIALAGGPPPVFKMDGAGTLAALGTAGKVTGGPAGAFVQYHFNPTGMIRPYVGAGVAVLVVFKTKDVNVSNLKVKSALGPGVGGGVDVMLNDTWGIYGDVKKAWIKTTATAFLGPAPVRARVTVDPLVLNMGVSYHF